MGERSTLGILLFSIGFIEIIAPHIRTVSAAAAAAGRLRDEGQAYGAALRQAGVRATIRRYPCTVHGFCRWLACCNASRLAVGAALWAAR
jgi:acetyl esterase/lipase